MSEQNELEIIDIFSLPPITNGALNSLCNHDIKPIDLLFFNVLTKKSWNSVALPYCHDLIIDPAFMHGIDYFGFKTDLVIKIAYYKKSQLQAQTNTKMDNLYNAALQHVINQVYSDYELHHNLTNFYYYVNCLKNALIINLETKK